MTVGFMIVKLRMALDLERGVERLFCLYKER